MGHLNKLYHMFAAYWKKNHDSELVFDPSDQEIDMSLFSERDWSVSEFWTCACQEITSECTRSKQGLRIYNVGISCS